jgi:hypothetical protein
VGVGEGGVLEGLVAQPEEIEAALVAGGDLVEGVRAPAAFEILLF